MLQQQPQFNEKVQVMRRCLRDKLLGLSLWPGLDDIRYVLLAGEFVKL